MSNIPLVQNIISDKFKYQSFAVGCLFVIALCGFAVVSATNYFHSKYSDFQRIQSSVIQVSESYYASTSGPGGSIPIKVECLRIQVKNGAVFYLKKSNLDWKRIQQDIENNLNNEIEFFYLPYADKGTGTLKAIKIGDNFVLDKIEDKSDSIFGIVFFSIFLIAAVLVMVYFVQKRREFIRQKSS